jgi:hypothetical protein
LCSPRIKEVWIGIEDPDSTVDRKGIKYLQNKGVAVHMFDRELQEAIKVANKEFIAQALERAAAARLEKKPKRITLSPLEGRIANVNTNDLSTEALAQYREIAKIDETVGSPDFNRRLDRPRPVQPDSYQLWVQHVRADAGDCRAVRQRRDDEPSLSSQEVGPCMTSLSPQASGASRDRTITRCRRDSSVASPGDLAACELYLEQADGRFLGRLGRLLVF